MSSSLNGKPSGFFIDSGSEINLFHEVDAEGYKDTLPPVAFYEVVKISDERSIMDDPVPD